jgi:uncharacterized protein YjbJ (UPF0337 family)
MPARFGSPQGKPKHDVQQENDMKSSTKDKAEGTLHQVKGKVKEVAGKISGKRDLEIEGILENNAGKVQEKIGDMKKVLDK